MSERIGFTSAASKLSTGYGRDERLDRLRGLAVLLMVADHVILVGTTFALSRGTTLSATGLLVADVARHTVTRLALPIFGGIAGYLLADRDWPSRRRVAQLAMAAVFSQAVFTSLPGLPDIDVLVVFLFAFAVWPAVRSWPIETAVVGFVVAFNMPPFPNGLTGYHVGLVVAFMALGVLARRTAGEQVVSLRMRLPNWFAVVGRRPLTAYIAHLCVLKIVIAVL